MPVESTGSELHIWTVSEITAAVREALERPELQSVWVEGEVSNLRRPGSGHVYFTLKDSDAALRCVLFKSDAARIAFKLSDGMDILARGRIGVYERAGEYQLYVRGAEPAGLGSLHLALEQLRRKLEAEGVFDPQRKRPLPRYPRDIGVVTSRSGAALRDIVRVAGRRHSGVNLVLSHASVQGESAPGELMRALRLLERTDVDAIIIGRGGGSIEDLWGFNDEELVRAVADCPIPVVAAVGHETDFTLVDLAADARASTPSSAAEMLVPDISSQARELQSVGGRLSRALQRRLERARSRIRGALYARVFRHPEDLVRERQQRVDRASEEILRGISQRTREARQRLESLAERIRVLDPSSALGRGFALVTDLDGILVTSGEELQRGQRLQLRFARGGAEVAVEDAWREDGDTP
ncbi:MAG: exodeoxyribonuclease VII large subunit [Clostridia bacterium]